MGSSVATEGEGTESLEPDLPAVGRDPDAGDVVAVSQDLGRQRLAQVKVDRAAQPRPTWMMII